MTCVYFCFPLPSFRGKEHFAIDDGVVIGAAVAAKMKETIEHSTVSDAASTSNARHTEHSDLADSTEALSLTESKQKDTQQYPTGPSRPVVFRHAHTVGQDPEAIDETLGKNRRVATAFMLNKCEKEAAKNWDKFYKRHEDRFFKNKNWTEREFAEEIGKTQGDAKMAEQDKEQDGIVEQEAAAHADTVMLEVGCGPGNTLFPILGFNERIKAYACDFAEKAINILKINPSYDKDRVNAFVYDIVKEEPVPLRDVVSTHPFGRPSLASLIFVLSAIPPRHHRRVLESLVETLRPGGTLCFRDFAKGDLAQVRFHSKASAAWCEPALLSDSHDFYRRGDNTFTYFFRVEELEEHALALGLVGKVEQIEINGLNRRTGVKLHRRFVQAKWKRAVDVNSA